MFKALERYLLELSGQPRFKGAKRPLNSIEGKTNAADLRWNEDEWLWSALQNPVKYCRIVRRFVGDKNQFALQLVMEEAWIE